jgi:hypothetical protein
MSLSESEREIFGQIVPRLSSHGYNVYIEPPSDLLPDFMIGYRSDAIALGNDKNIAFEIVTSIGRWQRDEAFVQNLFTNHPEWELKVIFGTPINSTETLPDSSQNAVNRTIGEILDLKNRGLNRPAILLGWATLEALARLLIPSKFARAQLPSRLIEALSSNGYITPSEVDTLRKLTEARNKLIHGNLNTSVDAEEVNPC